MALYITDDCTCCGACVMECPNGAIYEGGEEWDLAGVQYDRNDKAPSGAKGFAHEFHMYIVPDKCTECIGFHNQPQCATVCPVDCCLPDPNIRESRGELELKVEYLNLIDPVRAGV